MIIRSQTYRKTASGLENDMTIRLLDYIILFLCSTIFFLTLGAESQPIICICIAISIACLSIYFDLFLINLLLYIIFFVLSLYLPGLMFYSPLVLYKFFNRSYMYISALYFIIYYYHYDSKDIVQFVAIFFLLLLAFILKYRTDIYMEKTEHFNRIRENLTEYNTTLHYKNRELMEKQDYEVTNATLNERNRIAREIHDSVGHILSSSILQIAALTAIAKDDIMKENLQNINQTLTEGMNSIRASIHNIHEDSIDLNLKLKELVDGFQFCEIKYTYEIENDFSIKAKYTIIFIVKEALTNIMKHSNATTVKVSISQTPAFYKIDIHDNGTNFSSSRTKENRQGMGTISIYERITALNGTINISQDDGYRIYITFPIETDSDNN